MSLTGTARGSIHSTFHAMGTCSSGSGDRTIRVWVMQDGSNKLLAVAWVCAFVDAPTGLRFEGDLNNELARVNAGVGAQPCVSSRSSLI